MFCRDRQAHDRCLALAAKATLLRENPEILRKHASGGQLSEPRWSGLPCDQIAKLTMISEARDRQAEDQRLVPRSGRARRYQAPEKLRGKRVMLVDGRTLDIPEHGFCEVADGRHPAARDDTASPAHRQLMDLGFRLLPDDDEDQMATMKAALRRPMYGDRALIGFLNRNAGA